MDANTLNTLLVEDQVLDTELMTKYLARLGCSVVAVSTGREAIAFIDSGNIDLVVCDVHLADKMTGFELLEHTRLTQDEYDLPFILVTASKVETAIQTQLKHGRGVNICQKWDGVIQKVRDYVHDYKLDFEPEPAFDNQCFSFKRLKKLSSWRPWS